MAYTTVGQRIAQLIQQLGISKNAFAVSLDKTATVIQHLVEERNKPGFDLLCRIFEVYPNVSKDWLLQGRGAMFMDADGDAEHEPGEAALATPAGVDEPVQAEPEVKPAATAPVVVASPSGIAAAPSAPQQTQSPVATPTPAVAASPAPAEPITDRKSVV